MPLDETLHMSGHLPLAYSAVLQHTQSWVQMPTNACGRMICKYMGQKGSTAILTSAGIRPVVNLSITTGKKVCKQGIHSGFETYVTRKKKETKQKKKFHTSSSFIGGGGGGNRDSAK